MRGYWGQDSSVLGTPQGVQCQPPSPCVLPAGLPFPRLLCTQGQFACEVLGCVEAAFVCDGQEDCLDGSDERHCGEWGEGWGQTLIATPQWSWTPWI